MGAGEGGEGKNKFTGFPDLCPRKPCLAKLAPRHSRRWSLAPGWLTSYRHLVRESFGFIPSSPSPLAAAAACRVGNAVAGSHLHVWFGIVGGRRAHPLLNLASHGQEGLLDVAGVLCRCLQEGDSQAIRELLHSRVSAKHPTAT